MSDSLPSKSPISISDLNKFLKEDNNSKGNSPPQSVSKGALNSLPVSENINSNVSTKTMPEKMIDLKDFEAKKIIRAKRFGISIPEIEKEKALKRIERFGLNKKNNLNVNINPLSNSEYAKRLTRLKRFGAVDNEKVKRSLRQARFCNPAKI